MRSESFLSFPIYRWENRSSMGWYLFKDHTIVKLERQDADPNPVTAPRLPPTLPTVSHYGLRTAEPWSQAPFGAPCRPHRHCPWLPNIRDVHALCACPGPGPQAGIPSPSLFTVLTWRTNPFILQDLRRGLRPGGSSAHFPSCTTCKGFQSTAGSLPLRLFLHYRRTPETLQGRIQTTAKTRVSRWVPFFLQLQ